MSRVEELLRPEIRRMENYQVQPVSGEKLDANESPFSLPAGLKEKLIGWLTEEEDLRVYPDTDCGRHWQRNMACRRKTCCVP